MGTSLLASSGMSHTTSLSLVCCINCFLRRAAFETESPAALSIEASNEERNSRIQAESSEDAFPLPDSLAPVFLTKK